MSGGSGLSLTHWQLFVFSLPSTPIADVEKDWGCRLAGGGKEIRTLRPVLVVLVAAYNWQVMMLLAGGSQLNPCRINIRVHERSSTLALNRLGERDGEVLVQKLAGNAALTPDIVAEIAERTDGCRCLSRS